MPEEKRVAIMGGKGSFHDIAARKYFGDKAKILETRSFPELVKLVQDASADAGLMAIENSTAGGIMTNYPLLRNSGLHINGEIYLQIALHLCGLKGVALEDIKEIWSHPMAILQCRKFLNSLTGVQIIEHTDTARSAERISKEKLNDTAAISSLSAADLYGLNVLVPSIQNNQRNFTRFLALSKGPRLESEDISTTSGKAMLFFRLRGKKGSLASILSKFADSGLSIKSIHSLPSEEREWEYYFHLDIVYDRINDLIEGQRQLMPLVLSLEILGIFPEGRTVSEIDPPS